MATIDDFKKKMREFKEEQNKIITEIKAKGLNDILNQQDLKNRLVNLHQKITDYKKKFEKSNYAELLSSEEKISRKDDLSDLISKCNKYIGQYWKESIPEEKPEKKFSNKYEQMLYEKKKLKEQDELIEGMIKINDESKHIGKEVKKNLDEQNKHISLLGENLDKAKEKAGRLNERIMGIIAETSYWKYYAIITILAIILYIVY